MSISTLRAQLVLIAADHTEAERLIEQLRSRGTAASGSVLPDAERLRETIEQRGGDLIVYLGDGRTPALDPLLTAHAALPDPPPLVLVADPQAIAGLDADIDTSAVADIVPPPDGARLERALRREFAGLLQRRHIAQLEHLLTDCEQRGREQAMMPSTGIALVQDGLHLDVNPAYPALFGYSTCEAILPIPLLDLFPDTHQQTVRDLLRQAKEQALEQAGGYNSAMAPSIILDIQRMDGHQAPVRLLAAPAHHEGEPCVRLLVQSLEVVESDNAPQPPGQTAGDQTSRLRRVLTAIEARLDVGQAHSREFTLIAVRIRKSARLLRDLGPSHALAAFDRFGERLAALAGEYIKCERLSDETFVLLADALDETATQRLATEIIQQIDLPGCPRPDAGGTPVAAIGWLMAPDSEATAETLLDTLYQQCQGAGQAQAIQTGQPQESDEAALLEQIDLGLRRGRLRHLYQPIVSLHGDDLEHYSVRVDLLDQNDNLLAPRRFMEVAIRHDRSGAIDRWSIRHAIDTLARQHQAGLQLNLFVSLSESSLHDPDTVLLVHDWMQEFDIQGRWLTFQLSEAMVRANQAVSIRLIESLRAKRCRIALGQFGIEQNPEMLLQRSTVDYLMLHEEIARDLARSKAQNQRLTRLVALAHEFKVATIVTGIEDASALPLLWAAGVGFVQGDFLQAPSPLLINS